MVTPSSSPVAASAWISAVSAVSTKNFMPSLRFAASAWAVGRIRWSDHTGWQATTGSERRETPGACRCCCPTRSPARSTIACRPGCDPQPGDVVLVPLNRREEVGVVWDARRRRRRGAGAQAEADHRGCSTRRRCGADLRRLVDWVAAYTLAPPGEVMAMALRVLRAARPARRRPAGGAADRGCAGARTG